MRFDCDAKARKKEQWHRWFAWYPVRLTHFSDPGDCRWWETIERSGRRMADSDGVYWIWSYRPRMLVDIPRPEI